MLQNYTHPSVISPVWAVNFNDSSTFAHPIRHAAAEAGRPGDCVGDARAVFDRDTDLFFFDSTGAASGTYDSYCIGVGGEEPNGPNWAWSRVYWGGHSVDGARIMVTTGEVILIGIGDVLHCDKNSLRSGVASCYWQAPGPMTGAIPAVAKNGSVAVGTFVGLSGGQLMVGYTNGAPAYPVQLGDISGYMGSTVVRTPGTVESIQFEFRNAVYNVQSDLLWVGFQGKCQMSGNHVCMGALEILVHPLPILVAEYQFDEPSNGSDGFLGGITVDHAGYVLATWVASSPTLADSMAVGGFAPDQPGYHYLTAYGNWRIVYAGEGGTGVDHPDYTECDTVPDSNLVIAHGLHKTWDGAAYSVVSDLASFNHCCNPRTGTCPQAGCP